MASQDPVFADFHPAVRSWFEATFGTPTAPQSEAWPAIKARSNTLIAAPTGSGKTLAAFLAAIDDLVWLSQRGDLFGGLEDETLIVYVSPLRALSNDIHRNLELPLAGIRDQLAASGFGDSPIRAMVRTGDTPQAERERMRRSPPHILVTTPESLYLLLTSESGRGMLASTRTVIVDEIHALAGNKRGAHLALSLERLRALCGRPLARIGLSATQNPIHEVASFLTGASEQQCAIIDTGHVRERDLALEVTSSPLEAVMSGEAWGELYERLADLVEQHSTTLIFVNTRRLAERLARHLGERLEGRGIDPDCVTAHHGSLAREHRFDAEQRLKSGRLRALVATASLELGIDIGDVDLVCQIGSPRAIGTFLQRVGRSGHAVGALPKGRLFPTTRDDLAECTALMDAVHRGELDRLSIPPHPLDVLAQQLVAEVSAREWNEDELFALYRNAWPYRQLARANFDAVAAMLGDGFATRRGRRSAYLHRDAVNHRLRARRNARLTALMNGGAIPDQFDYEVIMQPQGQFVGTLNEDFAFESLPGDIFQLGNTSYRILKVEMGKVHVADAAGLPPNIPFWFGEAPGRSDELSSAVSRLHTELGARIQGDGRDATIEWLVNERGIVGQAAVQLVEYLAAAQAALGALPSHDTIVMERFFDEAGDQHLVIHSPFGSRVNRAWGLALRKRFCRKFNFELQAAALEDSIVLSLGATHSFALEEVAGYLKSASVRPVLVQALLAAPMFPTHWRWNANIALAVRRMRNGKRTPAQFQRMDAEDLMAVVFPDQLACLENIAGEREVPEHPLVDQTLEDCLNEVMDIAGLERLLRRLEAGELRVIARDLAGPSPLAEAILSARPYAFLDDAPAEERRTQMVQARRFTAPEDAAALGRLDAEAIRRVREEAWPEVRDADELHDALLLLGCMTDAEMQAVPGGERHIEALRDEGRVCQVHAGEQPLWFAAERLHIALGCYGDDTRCEPALAALEAPLPAEQACVELLRARLQGVAITSAGELAATLGLAGESVQLALLALENEGVAMRGQFGAAHEQWCERGLLARIHRYTLDRLRREVMAVTPAEFMRFLFEWQGVAAIGDSGSSATGAEALADVIAQLEGFSAAAAAWEAELFPARLQGYWPQWLDTLCNAGKVQWARIQPPPGNGSGKRAAPLKTTPIALVGRRNLAFWRAAANEQLVSLSSNAERLLKLLHEHGASFYDELQEHSELLPVQLEEALAELAAAGVVSADSFAALRALLRPSAQRSRRGRRGRLGTGMEDVGRWTLTRRSGGSDLGDGERIEHIARTLLRRYGVVFRKLLERESGLPSWRELLYVYRRLEARGEVRGGRFVDQFSGEQFALPDAIGLLRRVRRDDDSATLVCVSGADPLNLTGLIVPGERVPALTGNRVLFRGGVPIACLVGKQVRYFTRLDDATEWQVNNALLRRHIPPRERSRGHRDRPRPH